MASTDATSDLPEVDNAHVLQLAGAPWTGIGWSLALPCEVNNSRPRCTCRLKVGHGGLHEGRVDGGSVVQWP
jgi:hypothetical protein